MEDDIQTEYKVKDFGGKIVTFRVVNIKRESVFDCVDIIPDEDGKDRYVCNENIGYFSERYQKWIIREAKDDSDGATYAKDIDCFGWLFHDELCDTGLWEDGTPCTNWQGSMVLSDILKEQGFWFRTHTWFISTWLMGGDKLRSNGMF